MPGLPNIIIFNPDSMRADAMGHLGNNAAHTPNLDEMTQNDAMSFSNAYCQSPVCTPSRCSFMTGLYPHTMGHRTMHYPLNADEPALLKTLKESGYFVYWGGKNDLVSNLAPLNAYCDIFHTPSGPLMPDPHVWQEWRASKETPEYYDMFIGETKPAPGHVIRNDMDWSCLNNALEIVEMIPEDQPFCLYLPLVFPHPPYGVEEPWFSCVSRDKIGPRRILTEDELEKKSKMFRSVYGKASLYELPEERFTEIKAVYLGMCARIDHQFGMLMQALKDKGLYDDTAVFFFSDHGDFTGDYSMVEKTQNCFEDPLVRVPFIVKLPSYMNAKPGVSDCLVELMDFISTVEDLTGIPARQNHFGKSLIPVIKGDENEHRDAVFCEGGRLPHEFHCSEIHSLELPKIAYSLYGPKILPQFTDNEAHGKALMVRVEKYKYIYRLEEQDELYDLEEDPFECRNIINEPHVKDVVIELRERALRFMIETADTVPWKAVNRMRA